MFEPKQVFLPYTKVACKNMSLNNSDSWHLVSQTCFCCKTYCATPCDAILLTEETITVQILAHMFTAYFHHFNEFQNF